MKLTLIIGVLIFLLLLWKFYPNDAKFVEECAKQQGSIREISGKRVCTKYIP